jgi:hypothetical protein
MRLYHEQSRGERIRSKSGCGRINPATVHGDSVRKQQGNHMTLIHQDAITHGSDDQQRDTLTSYVARCRFALYFLLGTGVAAGVTLNWNWVTSARLLPILAFLPCMVMTVMCMRHGSRGSDRDEAAALPAEALPSQPQTSPDPPQ